MLSTIDHGTNNMTDSKIVFNRIWSMPSGDTFSIRPIKDLLNKWIKPEYIIIDPFARNSTLATYRNDLNPKTDAEYHMKAEDFCSKLIEENVSADLVLFDPPYSPRQISELYQGIGLKVHMEDTQTARLYKTVQDGLHKLLKPDGIAISFGWNSRGFGKVRGYKIEEILLVPHGGAHNDTIVVVERKLV